MTSVPAASTRPESASRPWVWLAVLGVLLVGLWATVFVVVPHQKRYYDEFAMRLPEVTMRLIDLSFLFREWWFVFVPGSVVLFGSLVMLVSVTSNPKFCRSARRITMIGTLLVFAALILSYLSLGMPHLNKMLARLDAM